MKHLYLDINEVWDAISSGKIVYWQNTSYKVVAEPAIEGNEYQKNHHSFKKGKILAVRCITNWFGSILDKSEIKHLFTVEES